MEKTSVMLSVICPKDIFEADYSFLAYHFPVVNADSIDIALRSSIFLYADVMLFDCAGQEDSYQDLLKKINEVNPRIRIIASWDFSSLADTSTVSRLFYCFKKPITEKNLISIVESAVDADHTHEKRSEPRLPVEIPVDLCRNGERIRSTTLNLSLNGLQARISETETAAGISGCRLYFRSDNGDSRCIDIPVEQKYVNRGGEQAGAKAGFSFRETDEQRTAELYRLLTAR